MSDKSLPHSMTLWRPSTDGWVCARHGCTLLPTRKKVLRICVLLCKPWCLTVLPFAYGVLYMQCYRKFGAFPLHAHKVGSLYDRLKLRLPPAPTTACYNFSGACCCRIFCFPLCLLIFTLGVTQGWVVRATPGRLYLQGMIWVSIAEQTGWTRAVSGGGPGLFRAGMEKRKSLISN